MGDNKKKKIDAYDFMKVDDNSHKQFINEWYSHPETKRRLRNAFVTPSDKSLNSLYSLGESYAQITGKNPFSPELNSQVDSLINTSLNKINNAEGYYEFPDQLTKKYSGVNENTLGFTLKNNPENYIINNKNRDINRSVPLHELTHISGLDVFNDSNFKNSKDLTLKHSKDLADYKKYLINEPEVYPRVMEIRFNNKIKPGQIIKKGDIDTNHRSFQELMKIYNNENEVYDILNTMANNTEASDNLVQSMNGGKINNMRKKKYFVGGAVTTGASALGASDSVAQGVGNLADIGVGVGRLAAGDVSAVPGLLDTAGKTLMGGFNNSIGLMTNKNASFGDKALGAIGMLGATNPLFSMVTGSRIDKLNQMAADDDQMNNIIKNNRMANGGKVKNDFQEYRNPFQTLQGITPRIPVNNPVELQRPPDRYTNTPMQGIPQGQLPNQGAPQMLDKLTGIPSYATFAPEQLYRNLSTNQYAGVPTTLPKKGERVNIEELSTARNEKLRNKNLMDYITKSLMTSQTIHGDSKGNIEDTWRNYVQSPQGMERLEQATNPSMMNFADGGQLTQFNGGFTHNDQNLQNSFEGIPQGMSPTGEVNTVEKGETRWQDFIFSDKLKLDKNTAVRLGFKKTDVGKTFADLSKKYSKESEDRPNDPITAKTLNIHMENLMAANENAKQINEIGEVYKMAKGGELNFNKYYPGGPIGTIAPDNRNFMERWGDRLYQSYTENKPALFKDFPITDMFDPTIAYFTGNTPPQYDMQGNPISSGLAPTIGFKNMPYNKSINRTIPKQTYTKTGKAAFTEGAPRATHTKKPIGDFDLNYDPLKGGRKASPEIIAQRKAAKRASNLEKARAAKNEKAYQKLLDESSNVKSGVEIPTELEGSVKFGNNINLPNINPNVYRNVAQGLGALGIVGGVGYGLSNREPQPASTGITPNNMSAPSPGGGLKLPDFLNTFQSTQGSPERGIPYMYNDQIAEQAQQSSGNNAPQNTAINYLDIQQIMQNMSPEERRSFTQNLAETKNPFGELTKMGYTPGGKGVSWQQSGAEDPFYGGVNAEILNQVSNPNLMNQVFGGPKDSYTPEDLQRLQREIMNDPTASQYVVNPEQTDFGVDWMVASSMGPDFTAQKMTGKGTDLTVTNDAQLAPIPPPIINSSDDEEEEKDPKKTPNLPNLWPELGLAGNLGAMAMLDPTYMTPSTMSTGYLRPQMIDEQTMRGNIDAANRATVGALANVTGGSGAAQRAGLLGQGVNYMGATGNAFTQANQANNIARMQADQFNIGTQGNVARQNMSAINQANAMNTGIANQYNMEKADTFASAVGDYSVAGADRRMSNDASKFWGKATGYDPKTAQYLLAMQNANKPVEETEENAYGGIIKTRKRKLK